MGSSSEDSHETLNANLRIIQTSPDKNLKAQWSMRYHDRQSKPMKRQILTLGLLGGLLIAILKWSEYQFLILDHSAEIYVALIAALFAALGIGLGLKLTRPRQETILKEVPVLTPPAPFLADNPNRDQLGITRRELEILTLVAEGLTNREIATRLFVSENTVKTHCSRAFDKLGAKRRTQAVQLGKQLGLLP